MKSLATRIKQTLRRKPHWGYKRIAEHLGVDHKVVSVTASRHKIKFLTREDLEKMLDG